MRSNTTPRTAVEAAATLLLTSAVAAPFVAAQQVYHNSSAYESGAFGAAPSQTFVSRPDLIAPVVNLAVYQPDRLADGYIFFGWAGGGVERPSPIIMESDGSIVWIRDEALQTSDFLVQNYKGEDVLTAFSGDFKGPYAQGEYLIMNSSYELMDTADIVLGDGPQNMTDLHEFQITSDDTFLSLSFGYPHSADLSSIGGSSEGWTQDCFFTEFDSDNHVSFNFSSLEGGIAVSEIEWPGPGEDGSSWENPSDYCHLNSMEKDDDGSYLISLRGPSTIYKISQDGDILWRLGGQNSSFAMGDNTSFHYQHDARWLNASDVNPRYMSLFDNNRIGDDSLGNAQGMVLAVDIEAMSVELALSLQSSWGEGSYAQGSTRLLNNTNYIVGWGFQPHISEYSSDGELLFDMHIGAKNASTTDVSTYRAHKQAWVGRPNTVPAVGFANASIFASWNGATEVSYWSFATGSDTDALDQGDVLARTGFETNSTFSSDGGTYIAAVALDSNQDCLAVSSLYFAGNGSKSEVHGSCDSVKGLNEAAEPSYLKGSADDEDHDSSAAMAHLSFTWGGVLFLGAGTAVLLMM